LFVLALVQGWRAATVLFEGADAVRSLVGGADRAGAAGFHHRLNAEGARRFAERLRLAVAAELADLAFAPSGLTASIGLVAARGPAEFPALYRRADEALYQAKAEGKNRVVLA
jgi:diguanylate cyclase (GGDEF)-like protein